jgi:hypothetical protein
VESIAGAAARLLAGMDERAKTRGRRTPHEMHVPAHVPANDNGKAAGGARVMRSAPAGVTRRENRGGTQRGEE